jgi:hypothetical protein
LQCARIEFRKVFFSRLLPIAVGVAHPLEVYLFPDETDLHTAIQLEKTLYLEPDPKLFLEILCKLEE